MLLEVTDEIIRRYDISITSIILTFVKQKKCAEK